MHALLVLCAAGFALAGSWWVAAGAYLATAVVRDLTGPPFHAWLNGSITDSSLRATVLSLTSVAPAPASGAADRRSAWSATGTASAPPSRSGRCCCSRRSGCSRGPSGTTASSPSSSGASAEAR